MFLKDTLICVINVILDLTEGKIMSENKGVFKILTGSEMTASWSFQLVYSCSVEEEEKSLLVKLF